ncbi:uncharacterized protein LOC128825373 [Malaclemys terrapin pileata]|uniref:uncharacterized protein LOC128825373 n=1 Tax=Malaclemys terrapin pileata TaxID=2991368 RepID=UPI0023A80C48|nr:uncharacterized protein LOC128825373 [Malaclemys terrapin pileata]
MISSSRGKVRSASGSEKLCTEPAAVLGPASRMSVLQGETVEDQVLPPEKEPSEKSCCHYLNMPASLCEPRNQVEMESRERQVPSASSEPVSLRPEDSDFLPSVRLAGILCLVFILVSLFLVYGNPGQVPFNHCRALSSNGVCSLDYKLSPFRLLFPSQPETTWRALQRSVSDLRWADHPEGFGVSLVAVGLGEVRNTLFCLSKWTLSLLATGQGLPHSVRVQILDYKSTQLPWGGYPEAGTYLSIIYEREKFAPYGMTVAIQRSFDGSPFATETTLALLMNSTVQAGENSLHNLTSSIVSDILNSIYRTGRVPNKLWATARSLPVLVIRPEPYLEGGFIC